MFLLSTMLKAFGGRPMKGHHQSGGRTRPGVERLEDRRQLSGISLTDGFLVIEGTEADDVAEVRVANGRVIASLSDGEMAIRRSVNLAAVDAVVFLGGDGDDHFTNATEIPAIAFGDAGRDVLVGGANEDVMVGGDGDDILAGSEGMDVLYDDAGDNFVMGGQGDDILLVGDGHDQVYGEEGDDLIFTTGGDDLLIGDAGADSIVGGDGDDRIYGGAGADRLNGWEGANQLYGGSGADTLYGDTGVDDLNVGGPDTPVFATGLTDAQLRPIVDAAIARWAEAGLDTSAFENAEFRIADLPGDALGWMVSRSDGSSVIWIDTDAAGEGWFVDATPLDDREFRAVDEIMLRASAGRASTGVDLLTIVSHELGHAAGLEHTERLSIMNPELTLGARWLPDAALAAEAPGVAAGPGLEGCFACKVIEHSSQQLGLIQIGARSPYGILGGDPLAGLYFPLSYPGSLPFFGSLYGSLLGSSQFGGGLIGGGLPTFGSLFGYPLLF